MGVVSFSYSSNISVADYCVVFTMRIWGGGGADGGLLLGHFSCLIPSLFTKSEVKSVVRVVGARGLFMGHFS